jgi:predicted dehydrogenase
MSAAKPAVFGIVGGSGFRAQYYMRIAQAMPERFRVGGMVVRDEQKRSALELQWQIPAYASLDELLARQTLDFVVVSVSKPASPGILLQLAESGVPVLAETPPAPDLAGLLQLHEQLTRMGARIQVAEQYACHPMHAARLALARSGRLGRVTQATVSVAHAYHGISLLRQALGAGFEEARIRAMRFQSPIVAGPDRNGPPQEERVTMSQRDLAWFEFGEDKLGVFDFTMNQHRSWIRSDHISIRGDRGEIFDDRVNVLEAFNDPRYFTLKRVNRGEGGNLEGYFLQGIIAGETWVYRNRYVPARLYDDEIAIADLLDRMAEYAAGGPSFYGLPDASQDHYLGMLMEEAISTGEAVTAVRQPWADFG